MSAILSHAIVGILLAIFGYLLKISNDISNNAKAIERVDVKHETLCMEHVKQLDLIPVMRHDLDVQTGMMNVYFKQLDKYTTMTIHSPKHAERDLLGDKLNAGTITCKEAKRLVELCEELMAEESNPEKRFAAMQQAARVEALIYKMRAEMKRGRCDRVNN